MDYSPPHQSFICTPETLSGLDTQQSIEAWLESLRQDSPASHSAQLDSALPTKIPAMDGLIPLASFAWLDPSTFCWKTYQGSFLPPTSELSSVTWPRAGIVVAGTAYQLRPLAPTTRGTGSGLWPTPTIPNGGRVVQQDAIWHGMTTAYTPDGRKQQVGLESAVRRWPTPRAHETGDYQYDQGNKNRKRLALTGMIKRYPTPRASPNENRQTKRTPSQEDGNHGKSLAAEVGGKPNPDWVEWMMGVPTGWTGLEPLATDKFRQWLQKFGG